MLSKPKRIITPVSKLQLNKKPLIQKQQKRKQMVDNLDKKIMKIRSKKSLWISHKISSNSSCKKCEIW